jgi:hypothetical protein
MCIFSSGALENPRGSGFWKGEYMGKGMEQGRSVYEQPGTEADRILSQQGGFQVSKKGTKRDQRGMGKEKQKARGLDYNCTVFYVRVHNECL